MIYFMIITILISALGLIIYAMFFDRKYLFGLLVIVAIGTGCLSFYICYYVGTYNSKSDDVYLSAGYDNVENKYYLFNINSKWKNKAEIFGLNSGKDMLALRFNTELLQVIDSNKDYVKTKPGENILDLDKEYKYSHISKSQSDICFNINDGEDSSIKLTFKELEPGGTVEMFYIHEYKIPLSSSVYWEKNQIFEFK